MLRDTLTRGEQSLVDEDSTERVLETRHMYQRTMRKDIVAGIEALTGRRVIAFLSDNHISPDIAIESILLEPTAHESRDDDGAGAPQAG